MKKPKTFPCRCAVCGVVIARGSAFNPVSDAVIRAHLASPDCEIRARGLEALRLRVVR